MFMHVLWWYNLSVSTANQVGSGLHSLNSQPEGLHIVGIAVAVVGHAMNMLAKYCRKLSSVGRMCGCIYVSDWVVRAARHMPMKDLFL